MGVAGGRSGPGPGHRGLRLRVRPRVGRPGDRAGPAAHAAGAAALRVRRPGPPHLLRPAGAAGRRPARRLRQRAGERLDGRAGRRRRRHHAAGPAGLRRRPGDGRAGVPSAGTRRGGPDPLCRTAGRPGAGGPKDGARRVRRRRRRQRRTPAADPGRHQRRGCPGQGRGRLQPGHLPGPLRLRPFRPGVRAVDHQARRRERDRDGRPRRPPRRQRALRPHRVRLPPDGQGGRDRHDRVPSPRRGTPPSLHDQALRPRPGRRARAHGVALPRWPTSTTTWSPRTATTNSSEP